jgi:hypothetical protein
MKKILKKTLALIFAISIFGGVFYGCGNWANTDLSYVSIRINPELELVVNGKDIITAVNPLNEDAETLLADVLITGMPLADGAELIVKLATEAGFIDVDSDNEVFIDVVTDEDDENPNQERITKREQIRKKLQERIDRFFDNNGIFGRVSQETLTQYLEDAQNLGVSPGKLKLIMRALDLNPDLTLNDIKDKEVKEIVQLIRDNIKDEDFAYTVRQEYKAARQQLINQYVHMFELQNQIKELRARLYDFDGTDLEKELLEQELKTKIEEHKMLKEQYEQEKRQLKERFKAQAKEVKETKKREMEQRKEQFKNKLEQRKQEFEKNKEQIKEQINNWRKGQNKQNS